MRKNAIRLKCFFAAATTFAAVICAVPAYAGFLSGDSTLDGSFSGLPDLTSIVSAAVADIDRFGDAQLGAAGPLLSSDPDAGGPTGYYYLVSDSRNGNTFIFTGTWMDSGSCTADKCISDRKDPPLTQVVVLQAVPEPGSVMLLGLALGALGFIIRRRNA